MHLQIRLKALAGFPSFVSVLCWRDTPPWTKSIPLVVWHAMMLVSMWRWIHLTRQCYLWDFLYPLKEVKK